MKKFLVIVFLILIDFLSKKFIFYSIGLNSFVKIFPFLDFAHIHNYGISFGLFSGVIPSWLIIIIGLIISIVIIYIMVQTSNIIEKWGYIMIIAGAFSNIADRAMNNYVLDFIYLHYKDFYWPAFNFADIYITLGVTMVFYEFIKGIRNKIKNE